MVRASRLWRPRAIRLAHGARKRSPPWRVTPTSRETKPAGSTSSSVAKGCPFPLPAGSPPDPEICLGTLLEDFPTIESIIEAARRGGYEVCGLDRHTGASGPETRAVHRRAARLHPIGRLSPPLPSSDDEPGNRRRACILLSGAIRRGKDCSVRPIMPGSRSGLKDARFPQISAPALRAAPEIRLPHAPPLAVAFRDP